MDGSNQGDLIQGFDQEAAAVLMGRVVSCLGRPPPPVLVDQPHSSMLCSCPPGPVQAPGLPARLPCLRLFSCWGWAPCLLAAQVSYKMEEEEDFDATRWLGRSLIRLCRWVLAGRGSWGLGAHALAQHALLTDSPLPTHAQG